MEVPEYFLLLKYQGHKMNRVAIKEMKVDSLQNGIRLKTDKWKQKEEECMLSGGNIFKFYSL